MSRQITEKDDHALLDEWYAQAKNVKTMEDFHALHDAMFGPDAPQHDYGTVVHAVAALAIGAAWLANAAPQGGITGFQAGAVMWEFIGQWMHYDGKPMRLVSYDEMLYPQYEHKFSRTISVSTWDFLQKKARELLADNSGVDGVRRHWQSIADGVVPFGYSVGEDR